MVTNIDVQKYIDIAILCKTIDFHCKYWEALNLKKSAHFHIFVVFNAFLIRTLMFCFDKLHFLLTVGGSLEQKFSIT